MSDSSLTPPIRPENEFDAKGALLQAAMYYRSVLAELAAQNPESWTRMAADPMVQTGIYTANAAISQWCRYMEVPDE